MDKISRGVWPTHDTKTSMSPTASEPVAYRLVFIYCWMTSSLLWLTDLIY